MKVSTKTLKHVKNLTALLLCALTLQSSTFAAKKNACNKVFEAQASASLPATEILKRSTPFESMGGYSRLVKFLVDVRDKKNPHVHFIDTNKFKYHIDFVNEVLGANTSIEAFNEKNYIGPYLKRDFIPGSMPIKTDSDGKLEGMLELFSGDDMDAASISFLADQIQSGTSGFKSIKFHPLNTIAEARALSALGASRVILTRDLAANLTYLPLNKGEAVGYVRLIKRLDYEQGKVLLGPSDIAVFDQVPNDIGVVGGVITDEIQTPLSHINIKSMNRGTVNLYVKDGTTQFKKLEGKPIRLIAAEDGFKVKLITSNDAADRAIADFWKSRRKPLKQKPVFTLDRNLDGKLLDLSSYYNKLPNADEHRQLIAKVGAKNANLALLRVIAKKRNFDKLGIYIPEVTAEPFNAHEAFLNLAQAGLDSTNPKRVMTVKERVVELLNSADLLNADKIHPIDVVSKTLAQVRDVISKAQVPDSTIAAYKDAILTDTQSPIHISKVPRFRLRSSTNSEDLEGFTGAGLYDSKGIDLYKEHSDGSYIRAQPRKWGKIEEDLRETIPALYASIFNDRAYMEREWFGINGELHMLIHAALVVHNAFPLKMFDHALGEIGNGVAITANPYRLKTDYPVIFFNSQHWDLSVTNPPLPEELEKFGEATKSTYSTDEQLVTILDDLIQERTPNSWKTWSVEQVRTTSIKGGAPVLAVEEKGGDLRKLAHAIRMINTDMAEVFQKEVDDFPIDLEYKVFGEGSDRKIYIKQARPFVRPGEH